MSSATMRWPSCTLPLPLPGVWGAVGGEFRLGDGVMTRKSMRAGGCELSWC